MTMTIGSVVLRKPEPEDVPQLYAFRNDPEVTRWLGGFSSGYSQKELLQWIDRHNARDDEVIYVIADRQSNRCLGHVGLYNIEARARSAEFAILIGDKDSWGQGLGKSVSWAMVEYGFSELNLHRIYLEVLATNQRAVKLYQRLGFQQEGVLRDVQFRQGRYLDMIVMGMLEDEFDGRGGAE